jgi:hypothetical protein
MTSVQIQKWHGLYHNHRKSQGILDFGFWIIGLGINISHSPSPGTEHLRALSEVEVLLPPLPHSLTPSLQTETRG